MINSNLSPILFSIGNFEIRYYSLIFILGFLLALWYLLKKQKELNLSKDEVYDLIFYLILGVIISARFFHVFVFNPSYYFSNPSEILKIWHGGVSYHGGLIGAALVSYWYSKKKNISLAKLADIIVLPTALILAFGRIANFFNAELIGKTSNLPWCVNFPGYESCRHPTQLYSAIYRFAIFGYLLFIKNSKPGFLFWNYLLLESIGRLIVDFFRVDLTIANLTGGQWFSIAIIIISGYVLIKKYRN